MMYSHTHPHVPPPKFIHLSLHRVERRGDKVEHIMNSINSALWPEQDKMWPRVSLCNLFNIDRPRSTIASGQDSSCSHQKLLQHFSDCVSLKDLQWQNKFLFVFRRVGGGEPNDEAKAPASRLVAWNKISSPREEFLAHFTVWAVNSTANDTPTHSLTFIIYTSFALSFIHSFM